MLGRNGNEETGGIRTLRLARGTTGINSPSRPPAQRTASGNGSYHGHVSTSKAINKSENSSGLSLLVQSGIVELLNQDDRPTFILDMTEESNYEPGALRITFANSSLRTVAGVMETISGTAGIESPHVALTTIFSEFKAWAMSHVREYEPLDVVLPTFTYAGALWSCNPLRKRFRVFRGVPISPKNSLASNPPSLGQPSTSSIGPENDPPSRFSVDEVRPVEEEPRDYFGRAGKDAVSSSNLRDEILRKSEKVISKLTDNDEGAEAIARGLKISKLSQPFDLPIPASSKSETPSMASSSLEDDKILTPPPRNQEQYTMFPTPDQGFFDWTRLTNSPTLPRHIQFAKSIDWASTSLGPIDGWSSELRSMCNLIMASPHPAAMYWGEDLIAIYNEAYIYLAGQKHPQLMGQSYKVAWAEIWESVKGFFDVATKTGESTMKEDDCLFIQRAKTDGKLEEAWFDWSLIPLVGGDGAVVGLYNPAFEKTKRKVGERRMGTLSSVGEKTSTAKDLETFWTQVILGLEPNAHDAPFVLLYAVTDEIDSDSQSSGYTNNAPPVRHCNLKGSIGIPKGHPATAPTIDLRDETEYFAGVFRDAAAGDRPIVLSVEKGTLDPALLEGIEERGNPEPCVSAVCCPVQSTRNETLGYLVMGINPRRPYDDDYSTYVQMLGRQISTAIASVVLFEEEIRAGMKAKRRADIARIELSKQLAVQTQAAVETERKFTQMAKFAPVGIFMADANGTITFRNEKWFEIVKAEAYEGDAHYQWMDAIKDDDKDRIMLLWSNLVNNGVPMNAEVRFKSPWEDPNGQKGDTWVLASGHPERDENGDVEVIFGSITDISQQKWAEHYEKRRMEEAVENKRQQENFIDITSHEMRNPLSAILQCADEISTSLTELKANDLPPSSIVERIKGAVEAAGTIALCAQHQKRIVDDILTLSKLDSALLLVTPCDVMPKAVVQRALKMFDGEVQTADIKLHFQVDESVNRLGIDWVKLDPSRLLQVLINLTTNAIKFTQTQGIRRINVKFAASLQRPSSDGAVTYFATRSKKEDLTEQAGWGDGEIVYIHFAVQDTGRGLTDDEKKLMFLRFSQASPRTHVQYGGSGLGLFISRQLVELQGGEIGVASKAGEGSTFAFYVKARRSTEPTNEADRFPGAGCQPASSRQTKAILQDPSGPGNTPSKASNVPNKPKPGAKDSIKILIVEDNLVNQTVLARQLKNLGVTVHIANHGGECLDKLKDSTFWQGGSSQTAVSRENHHERAEIDVILMDQEMPVMDGLTCTKEIRDMERDGRLRGHVPIIAVTANARSEQIDTAMNIGMVSVPSCLIFIHGILTQRTGRRGLQTFSHA